MPCAPGPGSMAGLLERGARLWGTLLRRRPTVCAALFLKKTTRRVDTAVACSYGKDSALGHLLGVSRGQETPAALGQHPPPVSFHKAEQDCLLVHRPDQPENPKVLRVAIIGAPNAGKSTLSNELLGRKVFPVSKKVHTTRCQAQGVITDADTQMILLDTPGLITKVKVKRHNLETSLLQDPWHSMKSANVVLVLVDISDSWTCYNLHPEVLKCLSKFPELPSILVMNKVDLVKKKGILLDLVEALTDGFVNGKKLRVKSLLKPLLRARQEETSQPTPLVSGLEVDVGAEEPEEDVCGVQGEYTLGKQVDSDSVHVTGDTQEPQAAEKQMLKKPKARKGWPHFQEVFMLSAVSGEEVDTLKRYLLTLAKPSPWEFHSDVVTTQSPQEICNNIIRSKLLDHLPQEVPYNVTQTIELWEEGPGGELVILQKLLVQKERHVKMLIGQGGQVISKIAQEAGDELMNIFLCDVRLRLSVKMKK